MVVEVAGMGLLFLLCHLLEVSVPRKVVVEEELVVLARPIVATAARHLGAVVEVVLKV